MEFLEKKLTPDSEEKYWELQANVTKKPKIYEIKTKDAEIFYLTEDADYERWYFKNLKKAKTFLIEKYSKK